MVTLPVAAHSQPRRSVRLKPGFFKDIISIVLDRFPTCK